MDEKRLGSYDNEGRMIYPLHNIHGHSYAKPCTTVGVGNGRFVVVPAGAVPVDLINAVRDELQQQAIEVEVIEFEPKTKKSKP